VATLLHAHLSLSEPDSQVSVAPRNRPSQLQVTFGERGLDLSLPGRTRLNFPTWLGLLFNLQNLF
jgi:hypothetical protein